ncbi:MAG: helix-turn-helix domain-containing protein [Firmicutes bacterium]|jgi:transcriptional regulator with XRE-family HTH domain|nr:helix-turn-helix domain-containing protein [Bacillota bacterium]MCL5063756.1 helix-turn-helix domain-containing protein [Bacillota bacterium]
MMDMYADRSESFGSLIRRLRKSHSLSLEDLATQIGISPSYLSRMERGHRQPPPGSLIVRLAEALNVPPLTLLVSAGILNQHTLREMGVPPYGMDLKDWKEAIQRLSSDDWQEIEALIRTKLNRYRHS